MKIAIVYTGTLPNTYANSINTVKHADALHSLGHEVIIFHISSKYNPSKDIHMFYDIDPAIKIIGIKENKFFDRKSTFWKLIHYALDLITQKRIRYLNDTQEKTASIISKNDFDLVYARSFRTSIHLIKKGINAIIETHTPNIRNIELKRLLKLSMNKHFIGISTISEILKKNFTDQGVAKEKVLVQEDAVDINKFKELKYSKSDLRNDLDLPKDKTIVTYSGSLKSGKGIPCLIEVAYSLRDREDLLFLVVGGPDENLKKYKTIAKVKGIHNIKFTGFMFQEDVPKYLKASDILIMLYSYSEKSSVMDLKTTSPIKLFEYCASKVPIIVSNIPTISKVISKNVHALMQEPDDHKATKKNILKLIDDKELAEKLSQNAYSVAEGNTYIKRCKRILEEWQIEK